MTTATAYNLLDVDSLVEKFLRTHAQGITTIHNIYFSHSDSLSVRALVAELMDELRTGCVSFLNKDNADEKELDYYLFYIVNAHCKKKAAPNVKRKTEYLCPGCLFLGKENLVDLLNKYFRCDDCEEEMRHTTDPKRLALLKTFFKHNKIGYRCQDCERFIPHPIDDSPVISCPYFDCCFVGDWSSLRRMHHPSTQSNLELLILDANKRNGLTYGSNIPSHEVDAHSHLEIQEAFDRQFKVLKEVIDDQKNRIPYSGSDFTIKHKYLIYEAFDNFLKKFPAEMVGYLLDGSRSGGFQSKVFQQYIKLLEQSLPYYFKKGNKLYKVDSL